MRTNVSDNQKPKVTIWVLQNPIKVRYICQVVHICSQLLNVFHDYCLFNTFDHLLVGIVFSCLWLKNYKNIVLRYSMTIRQYFWQRVSQITKIGSNAKQQNLYDCKIPQQTCESWQINSVQALFGFVRTNHGIWGQASVQNVWDRKLSLKIKVHEAILTSFLLW